MTPIETIVTSAAVGAVVSAGIAFAGQALERRSRREELLLSKAIDLAEQRIQLAKELVIEQKGKAIFPQAVVMAADYYRHLRYLLKKGGLSQEYLDKHAVSLKEWEAKLNHSRRPAPPA